VSTLHHLARPEKALLYLPDGKDLGLSEQEIVKTVLQLALIVGAIAIIRPSTQAYIHKILTS